LTVVDLSVAEERPAFMAVMFPFDTPPGADVDLEGVRLLAEGPVARAVMDGQEVWLALGYHTVRQVLSDPRFSREAAARPDGPTVNRAANNPELLISMDPPRHTRIRSLMAKAFSSRMVALLESRISQITEGLLDELAVQDQPADLVEALAEPLPIMVICELLGVPLAERPKIREWAGVLIAHTAYTPAQIVEAIGQVDAYLDELIAARRQTPDNALISALIEANDEGGYLSPSELTSNVQLLLIAGHETTVNQIGNSIVTLFQHPEQTALLRKNPDLLPQAADELLRFSKLTTSTMPRITTEDVMLGDVVVQAGEGVIPLIAVANRDPAVFPDPHRFDITRTDPASHLGMGYGPHYCLGAQLARLELRVVIGALLARFPDLAPAVDIADLNWKTGLSVRTLHALPVTW
jgi:cytochrome P450